MNLFNEQLIQQRQNLYQKPLGFTEHPLIHEIESTFKTRLSFLKRTFSHILITGRASHALCTYFQTTDSTVDQEPKNDLYDLIVSLEPLHTMNDVPGYLARMQSMLKPDGFFLGAFIGGYSLSEIRTIVGRSELNHVNGMAQRFHPAISARDAGALLHRAHFILPVADFERHQIHYLSLESLKRDLRHYGLGNALNGMHHQLSRVVYRDLENSFPLDITVDVIYLSGWVQSLTARLT
jgi:2-polyprenyl-3-methyl-5-hydroxy-6-metoxy-1,4-benzoquinol methylase